MKLNLRNVKMHLYVLEKRQKTKQTNEQKKTHQKTKKKNQNKHSVKTKMSGLELSVYLASSRNPNLQN